ncbi:hypothetical protein ACLF6K_33565 [Streptomyces xanthophaeus]|uniref:hypothetical protein n=1 Tax=Streptomyces xanthophaeus TaxID=67385 RepID=UPI0039901FC3
MQLTRHGRPLAAALLAAALALLATAAGGFLYGGDSGGYVLAVRAREHAVLLGWLVLAALTGAVLLGPAKSTVRLALCVLLLTIGIPVLLMASLLMAMFGGAEETKNEAAPGRDDRRLVVEEGAAMIDPLWYVYVHEGTWPLERRWAVGRFNGDDPADELREAVWTASDRLRVTTAEGAVHEVTVTPGGRPDRTVSAGW